MGDEDSLVYVPCGWRDMTHIVFCGGGWLVLSVGNSSQSYICLWSKTWFTYFYFSPLTEASKKRTSTPTYRAFKKSFHISEINFKFRRFSHSLSLNHHFFSEYSEFIQAIVLLVFTLQRYLTRRIWMYIPGIPPFGYLSVLYSKRDYILIAGHGTRSAEDLWVWFWGYQDCSFSVFSLAIHLRKHI